MPIWAPLSAYADAIVSEARYLGKRRRRLEKICECLDPETLYEVQQYQSHLSSISNDVYCIAAIRNLPYKIANPLDRELAMDD